MLDIPVNYAILGIDKTKGVNEMRFIDFNQTNRNLYRLGDKYYRLYGTGITPNGCWVINPVMRELIDINIASGLDIIGTEIKIDDICGTVPAICEFIK